MRLRFFNCPECDKATFIKADESNPDVMRCEYCDTTFTVGDTRPFEMSVGTEIDRTLYAC
jgi:transcription elongation factor Elf1